MKKLVCWITVLVMSVTVSACSDTDARSGDTAGDKFVVGTIPNPSVVAVYLAKDREMFEGLEVEPTTATGFAPNLAAVVNGESQAGFAAVVPLLVARSKGAPIKIISGTDAAPESYDPATDPDNVYTTPDSGIDGPEDLVGKTVAVNALGSIQDLGVKVMVENAGGDPDKVEFLTLPSADMIASLQAGRVDAIALSEPFNSAAREQGLNPIMSYVTSPTPGAPVGAFFTSERTLQQNGEAIEAFVAGIEEATALAQENPQAVRETVGQYTDIPDDVLEKMNTFPYTTEITEDQIAELSSLLVDYGYMDTQVSAEEILR